jgi:phosphonate transport system substrate-binding protein
MGLSRLSLSTGFFFLVACSIAACRGKQAPGYAPSFEVGGGSRKILTFGVPGQSFYESTAPLVKYLNDHLDSVKIQTVACSGIEDYEEKLLKGNFDLTVINGPQLIGAEQHGYRAVGQIADVSKAVIFVHKDSGIHGFSDVAGRSISLTGKNSLTGTIMPLMFLHRQGVDVNGSLRRVYAPSFEAAIVDVFLGHSSLGAVWKPAYEIYLRQRPEIAAKLEVRWETPPLVNAGILFRRSIDSGLAAKIAGLFFQMKGDEEGRKALQKVNISGFEPADSNSFRPMEAFLREYNAAIH